MRKTIPVLVSLGLTAGTGLVGLFKLEEARELAAVETAQRISSGVKTDSIVRSADRIMVTSSETNAAAIERVDAVAVRYGTLVEDVRTTENELTKVHGRAQSRAAESRRLREDLQRELDRIANPPPEQTLTDEGLASLSARTESIKRSVEALITNDELQNFQRQKLIERVGQLAATREELHRRQITAEAAKERMHRANAMIEEKRARLRDEAAHVRELLDLRLRALQAH